MTKRVFASLVLLGFAGCGSGSDPAGIEAVQIPVVIIDDMAYGVHGDTAISSAANGSVYRAVKRRVDCSRGVWIGPNTHVEDYCPLQDGESNFLPTGTGIHTVEGALPTERLAFYDEHRSEWLALAPLIVISCVRSSSTPGTLTSPGRCDT